MMPSARATRLALTVIVGTAVAALAQNPQSRGLGQATAAAAASKGTAAQSGKSVGAPAAPAAQRPPGAGAKPGQPADRDIFVPTIKPPTPEGTTQVSCPPGVRGILIGQAELNGVARGLHGIIAVVTTTNSGRTYFLREGNTLCNGRVVRITGDSIVFEENVIDPTGKPLKKEVIKRIPAEAK